MNNTLSNKHNSHALGFAVPLLDFNSNNSEDNNSL